MYYLFHRHHWPPGRFAAMSAGERDLTYALVEEEIRSRFDV